MICGMSSAPIPIVFERNPSRPVGAIFISFDAVAVSGITVEAAKIARNLARKGIKPYLDLGYDIKLDKGNFNRPYDHEYEIYEGVFELVRVKDLHSVLYYDPGFITHAHNALISGRTPVSERQEEEIKAAVAESSRQLADRITRLWEELNIGHVIVENGTLPENIIYTRALYLAIESYGRRRVLGDFVVWRDHDLMWNSEKSVLKYGRPPYPHAVKPVKSRHITYVTLNRHLKNKLEEWCDHAVEIKVKKNTYDFSGQGRRINIRKSLGIQDDDILIARTTRIIPQKRLDRDIHLVHRLNQLFSQHGLDRRVFLVAAGNTHEDPACHRHLKSLAQRLGLEHLIKFVGPLQHDFMPSQRNAVTVEDLYHSCDLVSFLTSWDYDSYGNPVGEAISAQRCYICTSYEYYREVYGQYGFEAPVMPISEEHDGLPAEEFIGQVYQFLNDKRRIAEVARKNFLIGRQVLSDSVIDILNPNRHGEHVNE